MSRKCITCGKIITGSVVEHYRSVHMGALIQHGEDKIKRLPDVFAPQVGTERAREMQHQEAKLKQVKKTASISSQLKYNPEYRKRVKMITAMIDNKCEEQTYREGKHYQCDVCGSTKTTGKRLLSYIHMYTICYDCYKTIKQANPQKRGNKHVFINTRM